jgi:ParB family chromosome partitioning protein
MLIVTETNLIQRSFADLSHSERAVTLSMHHEAIKRQGKRTDLINEIENLLKNDGNPSNNADFVTSSQLANKSTTMYKVGQEYGLSKDSVARYLRINKLIIPLKKRLDSGEFGIVPAVEISYLSIDEQDKLNMLLDTPMYKLDMKKAAQLREFSEKKELTVNDIEEILAGAAKKKSNINKPQKFTLKPKILSEFFKPQDKPDEIEREIVTALKFYRDNKPKVMEKPDETEIIMEAAETEDEDEYGETNMGDDTG